MSGLHLINTSKSCYCVLYFTVAFGEKNYTLDFVLICFFLQISMTAFSALLNPMQF